MATKVTAKQVKELREATGAPMMDCKKALEDPEVGSLEDAIVWLRKNGQVKAGKLSERVTENGLISVALGDTSAAIVEILSETDFVARSDPFQMLAGRVAESAREHLPAMREGDDEEAVVPNFLKSPCGESNVGQEVIDTIGVLRENIRVKRAHTISFDRETQVAGSYVHQPMTTGGVAGTSAAIVLLDHSVPVDADKKAQLTDLARKLAMHVVASKPACVSIEHVPAERLQKESDILTEGARSSGKPDKVITKMVEGGLKKYFEAYCLLHQEYIMNKGSVEDTLQAQSKSHGLDLSVVRFLRYQCGEEKSVDSW